jgi:hypothetical protein
LEFALAFASMEKLGATTVIVEKTAITIAINPINLNMIILPATR